MRNPFLNDIQVAKIKKTCGASVDEQEAFTECAQEFGKFVAMGERSGLSVPVAFEAARCHFRTYGKIMIELADTMELRLMPPDFGKHPEKGGA